MASKPNWKIIEKDKNQKSNGKTLKNEYLDEIALRDEIFDLKREILILKKSNERNLIKLRKYEDETKKKDRQIEQLMDPVKNGDIRKLLSTKGAALFLNLKEQNNTLIQMVLAKDVQIRKLLSEIKTSKLYSTSKRTESYRSEIDRLRNLLVKSQNMLKETQDIQQKRSICIGGTPDNEMVFSSDQSSPRDLEELHFTIQNLEMHMKYSNELLAKKNEQILQLTDQLNSLQNCNCRKNIQTKYFLEKYTKPTDENVWKDFREMESGRECVGQSHEMDSSSSKYLLTTSGIHHDWRRLAKSAPPCPVRNPEGEMQTLDPSLNSRQFSNNGHGNTESFTNGTWFGETHQFPQSEVNNTKEKQNSFIVSDITKEKFENLTAEEESDVDTAEFELMERKIENDQIEIDSPVPLAPKPNPSENKVLNESSPTDKDILVFLKAEEESEDMILENDEQVYQCEKTVTQNECDSNSLHDGEDGKENSESLMEVNHFSLDSSLDSDISAWNTVQVEAEINHDSEIKKCIKSDDTGDEDKNTIENNNNNNKNNNNSANNNNNNKNNNNSANNNNNNNSANNNNNNNNNNSNNNNNNNNNDDDDVIIGCILKASKIVLD